MIAAFFIIAFSKGQNKWGFETMVDALLTNQVDTITSEQLSEMMQSDSFLLLDSREPAEYGVSHIAGAKLFGYDSADFDFLKDADKSKPVVIYCSVGKRSENIGIELKKLGFTEVYNLYGGIFDWTNKGFPVLNSEGNRVEKVHPYNTAWGIWVNNYKKEYGTE